MKYIIAICLLISFVIFSCAVQKNVTVYEFPKEMNETVRTQFKEACDKGKILYEINCAECHNKTIKGKSVIPDFSPEALKGYEIRVANALHEENMPDEKVTPEELELISTFLTYKKKSEIAIK